MNKIDRGPTLRELAFYWGRWDPTLGGRFARRLKLKEEELWEQPRTGYVKGGTSDLEARKRERLGGQLQKGEFADPHPKEN